MAVSIQKILAPIQFNDQISPRALEVVRELALKNGSRIFLLHVIPKMVKPDLPGYRDLFADDESKVAQELTRIASDYLTQGSYETVVRTGDPAETIERAAQELGIDLIVMATHGREGLSHFVIGSIAEKVVREAPCPVLTVRPELLAPKK